MYSHRPPELSSRRAALVKQLAEIELFQHQAIMLAEQFGVRQKCGRGVRTEPRPHFPGCSFNGTRRPTAHRRQWRRALDWSGDRLIELSAPATDAERQAATVRRAAIYGERPAAAGNAKDPS